MKSTLFRNDILTKGAILGGVMLVSKIAEGAMLCYGCDIKWMLLASLEMMISVALYIALVYIFTRNYSKLVLAERPEMPYFTYFHGLSYVVTISLLAGVIASLGGHIFMHSIVGFENYVSAYVTIVQDAFSQAGQPVTPEVNRILSDLQSAPAPTIIDSLLGGTWNYLLGGTLVGLIVAIFTRRKPEIFDKQNEQ